MFRALLTIISSIIPAALGLYVYLAVPLPIHLKQIPFDKTAHLYHNRSYKTEYEAPELVGSTILQVPRHMSTPIFLEASSPFIAYRIVCDLNDNAFLLGWQLESSRLKVNGATCVLHDIVKKFFPAGQHTLPPGGPIAASPLLVRSKEQITAYTREIRGNFPVPFFENRRRMFLVAAVLSIYFFIGFFAVTRWHRRKKA